MDTRPLRNPFSDWLEKWTDAHADMTQQEQANLLGIRRSSLSNYLNGRALPARRNQRSIARALSIEEKVIRELVAQSSTEGLMEEEEEIEDNPVVIAVRQDKNLSAPAKERIYRIIQEELRRSK